MNRFRIFNIKGCKTAKQVMIGFSRPEEGEDYLELCAWHEHEGATYYQHEEIHGSEGVLNRVLLDFTGESANSFANSMEF
jgi:hypothetical protein